MIVPTIHMNGTSKAELVRGYEEAYESLSVAYEKMRQAAPNGRDYYPQSESAIGTAIDEHMERLEVVADLMQDYEDMIGHINDNRDGVQEE